MYVAPPGYQTLDSFIVDNVYMLSTRFVSRYVEDTALKRVVFHLLSSLPYGRLSRSRGRAAASVLLNIVIVIIKLKIK